MILTMVLEILLIKAFLSNNDFVFSLKAEAVPKKILELMNVDKLTRENVASHLQVISSDSISEVIFNSISQS